MNFENVSVEFTSEAAEGMHGAIVRAVKPATNAEPPPPPVAASSDCC